MTCEILCDLMPLDRTAAVQLGILLLVVPAQYLIVTYFGATGTQKEQQLKQIVESYRYYKSEYLSWEKWQSWCVQLLDGVASSFSAATQNQVVDETGGGESPAVEVLKFRHPEGHFASSTEARSPRPRHVKFRVGQVARHKKFGYRGVIIGWDLVPKAPESWLKETIPHDKQHLRKMPYYLLLVDTRDRPQPRTTYVAEENLEILQKTKVQHPKMDDYFEEFDGYQYLPKSRVKVLYPEG